MVIQETTVYQLLLKAHPAPMRAEYAREMELTFAALCDEQRGSAQGLAAVIFRETVDEPETGVVSGLGVIGARIAESNDY